MKRGFSLVELMIGAAVMGGVAIIGMQLTKQTTRSNAKFNFDTDVALIVSEINGILSNPQKCFDTFPTTTTDPTHIDFKYYTGTTSPVPAKGYENSGIFINNFTFTAPTFPATKGFLEIEFNNREILKLPITVKKTIDLYMEVSGANITRCRSSSKASADIWSRKDGSNNIYYGLGKVGVGPVTVTDAPFYVHGAIKIGSTSLDCDSANPNWGAQRYNSTYKYMQYCSSTDLGWRRMYAPEVIGVCNNTSGGSCSVGTPFADTGAQPCGTARTWKCKNKFGGGDSGQCSYTLGCPAVGVCDNGAPNGCATGSPFNFGGGSACGQTYTWQCSGVNLGANSGGCSYTYAACAIAGQCNNSVALGCLAGTAINDDGQTACGTSRTWTCSGTPNSGQCSHPNPGCSTLMYCNAETLTWGSSCSVSVAAGDSNSPVHLNSTAERTYGEADAACWSTGWHVTPSYCSPWPQSEGAEFAIGTERYNPSAWGGITNSNVTQFPAPTGVTWGGQYLGGGVPYTNTLSDGCASWVGGSSLRYRTNCGYAGGTYYSCVSGSWTPLASPCH